MDADWEASEEDCPKCAAQMRERRCFSCGGDGHTEDDDDLDFGTRSIPCDHCATTGWEVWCGECGWDETFKSFMSKDYEAAWLAKQATEGSKP